MNIPLDVPFDYMHQVLLGVVRTLTHNILKAFVRKNTEAVSALLIKLRLPYQDFNRQFRSITLMKYWKASEWRIFLFYGFYTLQKFVPYEVFVHFFVLSTAVRILCEYETECNVAVSKHLIEAFLETLPKMYREESQVFNMHSLLHLPDNVSYSSL